MRRVQHAGKAKRAGLRLMGWSLVLLAAILGGGLVASVIGPMILMAAGVLVGIWLVFLLFCLNFFRDPDPDVPASPNSIVAPAHGKVDFIDETTEPEFMGGPCRRISTFLSVFDIHVQNAPASGRVALLKYTPGRFFNAMNREQTAQNENLLIGLESSERPGEKIGVRLIAGFIARRIVNWVALNDAIRRGDRTSLIQFGSRVDLYLPMDTRIAVKVGDRVRGGETVVATRS